MKKYKLNNLDCANCTISIEKALNNIKTVKFAKINFATKTLKIASSDPIDVKKIIFDIEPDIKVTDLREKDFFFDIKREILKLLVPVFLFIIGVTFNNILKKQYNGVGEYIIFFIAYLMAGYKVLLKAFRNILKGNLFDENFLMSIATIGAFLIHALPEATGVMIFYKIGEFLEELSLNKSRKSIKSLVNLKPQFANLIDNNNEKKINPEELKLNDVIIVKPGESIPVDGIILLGESFVDTSALTGESVPKKYKKNDFILSGSINQTGVLRIKVTARYEDSSISKIMHMVEDSLDKKSSTEKFMTKFAKIYTPIVVGFAVLLSLLPPMIFNQEFTLWIYRALILLVISCPCALTISIPLSYFIGIGVSSKNGILIKGSNYLNKLRNIKVIAFDKTGTLTKGVFKVIKIVSKNGFSKNEIIKYAAYAEKNSNHPIAQSIKSLYNNIDIKIINDFSEISGYGIKVKVGNDEILAGNDKLLTKENIKFSVSNIPGTLVYFSKNKVYMGYMVIDDEIKNDAKLTINLLHQLGIKTIMLTGDNFLVAQSVSDQIGIDEYQAELLPEDKVKEMQKIKKKYKDCAFVGDGINDAPVLAASDVGIALGELGSDIAIESADVVLMTQNINKLVSAIKLAKKTYFLILSNIGIALGTKFIFVILGTLGKATMWEAVFADVGVTVLTILNSLRLMKLRE